MKRKRIQYNEINEETYAPKYWTKARLIVIGFLLLILGFLINFSLEEKVNKYLQTTLSKNSSCPVQFEKAELSYFLPAITLRRPVILGACFGQYSNRLEFKDIKIAFNSPSFYPVGLRFHVEAFSGKTKINLYPVVSLFTHSVKIENTLIDTKIFAPLTAANLSPVAGTMSVEGFFEFSDGATSGGELDIASKNFTLPTQNIQGFELTELKLETLKLSAHFQDAGLLIIDNLQVGKRGAPIELKLKGQLKVNKNDFMSSMLNLSGDLKLSQHILVNFAFIKLFLPASNTSGNYKMKINGPLRNPGAPQLL